MSHKSGPPPKKQKTDQKETQKKQHEEEIPPLEDEALKPTLDKLDKIQETIAQIDLDKSTEIIQIERKYNEKKKPHFKVLQI